MAQRNNSIPKIVWDAMNEIRSAIEDLDYVLQHEPQAMEMDADGQFAVEQLYETLEREYMEVENELQGID